MAAYDKLKSDVMVLGIVPENIFPCSWSSLQNHRRKKVAVGPNSAYKYTHTKCHHFTTCTALDIPGQICNE